jgi:hypothetical protein
MEENRLFSLFSPALLSPGDDHRFLVISQIFSNFQSLSFAFQIRGLGDQQTVLLRQKIS